MKIKECFGICEECRIAAAESGADRELGFELPCDDCTKGDENETEVA
jgi:hypothetical protein